jgi:hypothetical protein
MSFHKDYIKESLEYLTVQAEKWEWPISGEQHFIQQSIQENELLDFAEKNGSEKTQAIVKTIKSKRSNKYFNITRPMRYSIATDLLNKFPLETLIDVLTLKDDVPKKKTFWELLDIDPYAN